MAQIDPHAVQGLVLQGYGSLPEACFLLLNAEGVAPEAVRSWLAAIAGGVTSAAGGGADGRAVSLALGHALLRRLGAGEGWPAAFEEGMAARAVRCLGDGDAPASWAWGGGDAGAARVDAVVLLHADAPATLAPLDAEHTAEATARGLVVRRRLTTVQPARGGRFVEHFGFVDGVGQLAIANDNAEADRPGVLRRDLPENAIMPGELLLGYLPEIGLGADPILLSRSGSTTDVARDGSFLVVRQLQQDVAGFWRAVAALGRERGIEPEATAALLMGRRLDGTPLAAGALAPGAPLTPDAQFRYRDPVGRLEWRCPLGAHVRRANPRDSLGDDGVRSWRVVKQHRMVRRGRPYGDPLALPDLGESRDDGTERGLHFLCFVADIARQFEFVQGTWLNGETFADPQSREIDPVAASRDPNGGRFTLPTRPLRCRLGPLRRYVTVRSGGYFFAPGLEALRALAFPDAAGAAPPPLASARLTRER